MRMFVRCAQGDCAWSHPCTVLSTKTLSLSSRRAIGETFNGVPVRVDRFVCRTMAHISSIQRKGHTYFFLCYSNDTTSSHMSGAEGRTEFPFKHLNFVFFSPTVHPKSRHLSIDRSLLCLELGEASIEFPFHLSTRPTKFALNWLLWIMWACSMTKWRRWRLRWLRYHFGKHIILWVCECVRVSVCTKWGQQHTSELFPFIVFSMRFFLLLSQFTSNWYERLWLWPDVMCVMWERTHVIRWNQ